MKTLIEIKNCIECGDAINGRSDKKFCSDQCRVTFNNRINGDAINLVRNVNNAMRRNRRILANLNTKGKTKVTREKLVQNGFDFNYFTNICRTKEGIVCYYCYEQGYLPLQNELYLLVVKQDL